MKEVFFKVQLVIMDDGDNFIRVIFMPPFLGFEPQPVRRGKIWDFFRYFFICLLRVCYPYLWIQRLRIARETLKGGKRGFYLDVLHNTTGDSYRFHLCSLSFFTLKNIFTMLWLPLGYNPQTLSNFHCLLHKPHLTNHHSSQECAIHGMSCLLSFANPTRYFLSDLKSTNPIFSLSLSESLSLSISLSLFLSFSLPPVFLPLPPFFLCWGFVKDTLAFPQHNSLKKLTCKLPLHLQFDPLSAKTTAILQKSCAMPNLQ